MNQNKSIELYFDFVDSLLEANYNYIVFNLSILYFRKQALGINFKNIVWERLLSLSHKVNIFIPSFTFFDDREKVFDILHTRPTLGWLNDKAFKEYQKNFESQYIARTPSCIHSFISLGILDSKVSDSISPFHSFGKFSIWNYFNNDRGLWCEIGTNPNNSFSLIHDCEMSAKVPYRENIDFNVQYIDNNNISTHAKYYYFARKREISSEFNYNKILTLPQIRSQNMISEIDPNSYIYEYKFLHQLIKNQLITNPKFLFK